MQKILYTEKAIIEEIKNISYEIGVDSLKHPEPPVLICVLNGAFMFFGELVKNLKIDCEVDFIRVKSYQEGNTPGTLQLIKDIESKIKDRNVYIVDDIYETGKTIDFITSHLQQYNPKSITPVTLFNRGKNTPDNLISGFELQTELFIAGFGLDDNKLKRNLPFIFEV